MKAKKTPFHRPVFGICITQTGYSEVSREANPEDQWDADDLSHHHDISAVRPSVPKEHPDVTVPFEPVVGSTIHVLTAVWSTGDSFHSETGCTTHIGAFLDPKKAAEAASLIKFHARLEKDNMSSSGCAFLAEDGFPESVCTDWCGYFESLDDVNVTPIVVSPPLAPKSRRSSKAKGP